MDSEQTSHGGTQTLDILRRRAPWILLCLIVVAGVAYGYSKHQTKKYTATAALSFTNSQVGQIAGLPSSNSNALAQQASNLELVKLGSMAATTASVIGRGLTAQEVKASLSISGRGESSVVEVAATSTSPTVAAATANTYVNAFVKEQKAAIHKFFASALVAVKRQLAELPPALRFGSDGLDLQTRAHTLRLLSELGYNNAQVAGEALVPGSPSSPKTKTNTALAAVLGLLLGVGLAFLIERGDRRIREPEDLEAIYGVPLLGAVPKSAALRGKGAALPPAEAEAFSLIRARMRFFNVDRDVRTVVIVSPVPGDGKTTIARHLAEAASRLGSRVLLLEADLRHPTFQQQLEIQPGPGLADVLIGANAITEVTQSVALQATPGEGVGGRVLNVLPAGAVPPNPGELLDSRAMDSVLEQARSTYDLVVIDTPPLAAVSDAFPLLTKVDGVVAVGWIGRSQRDDAERLQQILAGSGAPLLGVIVNGAKSSGPSSYADPGTRTPSRGVVTSANGASSSEQLLPTAKS